MYLESVAYFIRSKEQVDFVNYVIEEIKILSTIIRRSLFLIKHIKSLKFLSILDKLAVWNNVTDEVTMENLVFYLEEILGSPDMDMEHRSLRLSELKQFMRNVHRKVGKE